MQLYAVNFIPLLSSLYISTTLSTATGTIIGWRRLSRLLVPEGATSNRDNLRQPMIVPVAVDTVVLLMMGVCAARNM